MILVVGATGLVGKQIACSLLQLEQHVRVLIRSGSPYQQLVDEGARPFIGDLKDASSLLPACTGVETVIVTASAGSRGGADSPQTVDLDGIRALIDAARAAGVRQFIFTSAIAASENSPITLLSAKAKSESYLRCSGVPYTILAPTTLMDVMLPLIVGRPAGAGLPVTLVGEGRRRHSFVAARDVAGFAVAAAGHPEAINRRIVIGGPQTLSLRDVISIYERALGRSIPVQTIAPGELLPNIPPVPGLAEVISRMAMALEMYESPIDMSEIVRIFGVRLTRLEEFVAAEVASVGQATTAVSRRQP